MMEIWNLNQAVINYFKKLTESLSIYIYWFGYISNGLFMWLNSTNQTAMSTSWVFSQVICTRYQYIGNIKCLSLCDITDKSVRLVFKHMLIFLVIQTSPPKWQMITIFNHISPFSPIHHNIMPHSTFQNFVTVGHTG